MEDAMNSTERHFALPYVEQLRQPDRPTRTRINALRERGEQDAAARLEAALDKISTAFRP